MLTDAAIKQRHAEAFRQCLIDLDVPRVRALWAEVAPHLAQPADEKETLFTLHMARTEAVSVPVKLRQYSHRWLGERGFGSHLPEQFWPRNGDRRA